MSFTNVTTKHTLILYNIIHIGYIEPTKTDDAQNVNIKTITETILNRTGFLTFVIKV